MKPSHLFLIAVIVFLAIWWDQEEENTFNSLPSIEKKFAPIGSGNIDESVHVSNHLQRVQVHQKLQKLRVQLENEKAQALPESEEISSEDHFQSQQLDYGGEVNPADQYVRKRDEQFDSNQSSPTSLVYEDMFRDHLNELEARADKKQAERERRLFIKQFLDNARKEGLEIILDKDLRVIDVREIPGRRPSSSESFRGGSSGS